MKLMAVVCYSLYYAFAKHLPTIKNCSSGISQKIRACLVRGFVDYCGNNVNIQPKAVIARRVKIGDFSGVGKASLIQGNVTIGEHVMMGPEVYIYTQNHCFDNIDIPMDSQSFCEEKSVEIEDDVWIGSRVTILPGVTVGKGSVIGASAVVTKDVPPYSVVAGNPAKVVKTRK